MNHTYNFRLKWYLTWYSCRERSKCVIPYNDEFWTATSTKFLMPCSIFDSFVSFKKFRRLRQFQCGAALLLVHCSLDQKLLVVIGTMVLNSKFWLVPRLFSLSLLDLNYCLGYFSWLENICHKQLLHPNSCFIYDYNLFTQLLIS